MRRARPRGNAGAHDREPRHSPAPIPVQSVQAAPSPMDLDSDPQVHFDETTLDPAGPNQHPRNDIVAQSIENNWFLDDDDVDLQFDFEALGRMTDQAALHSLDDFVHHDGFAYPNNHTPNLVAETAAESETMTQRSSTPQPLDRIRESSHATDRSRTQSPDRSRSPDSRTPLPIRSRPPFRRVREQARYDPQANASPRRSTRVSKLPSRYRE
jgi:hypothetical protein